MTALRHAISKQHPKKVIFLVTEDWYFCSHRLKLAIEARRRGYEVHVICRVEKHGELIRSEGLHLHEISWRRNDRSLISHLKSFSSILKIYRQVQPEICHHVALKPIVLGGLVARLTSQPRVINAVAGLGAVFTMDDWRAVLLRKILAHFLSLTSDRPNCLTIFQNSDDKKTFEDLNLLKHSIPHIVRGAGIDTEYFSVQKSPCSSVPTFAIVSRMLSIKGVQDAVEASCSLYESGLIHRLLLCGNPDPFSRASISRATLEKWNDFPSVFWLGHIEDVRHVWKQSDVAIQPSRGGEGLPKSLLEAAACGKPIIATDVPGCREISKNGVNAFLVKPNSPDDLAAAMRKIAYNRELQNEMGANSRLIAEQEFSLNTIFTQTFSLYET